MRIYDGNNKTGTSQVGAIPKARKAHTLKNMLITFFNEKLTKKILKHFRKTQTTELAHRRRTNSALKKRDHLGFLTSFLLQNIKKN